MLGEVLSVDNMTFGIGIAPEATGRVVSQWRDATTYDTAAAILSASQVMNAGDVLLLEAQAGDGGTVTNSAGDSFSRDYLPVQTEAVTFDAIRHVTDLGIIVVEAAGNGRHSSFDSDGVSVRTGIDLSTWRDADDHAGLDRNSADFRDSGAIMVGAATSNVPHARADFSNHGNRIDCFGWGENVYTLGYGAGAETKRETFGFSGTSSASPIVAGAAVLLQSWIKSWGKGYGTYSPADLRDLLSDPDLNTASANPAADQIGVMPNLRRIIETQQEGMEKVRFPKEKYPNYLTAQVLVGLLNDTPGVIWFPGKKPRPVDPGWQSIGRFIEGPTRDLLAALAVHEIAVTMSDGKVRARVRQAAVEAMDAAVRRFDSRK